MRKFKLKTREILRKNSVFYNLQKIALFCHFLDILKNSSKMKKMKKNYFKNSSFYDVSRLKNSFF